MLCRFRLSELIRFQCRRVLLSFLPSLAGLCFNQLCELWLLDSAFPLVTVCLCVCEGVCDSVLNMPLLVVTSIKRGENGFHFHVVLLFAFSLCVSFFLQPFSLFWRWRLRTQNWVRTTTMQGILVWNISAFFLFFSWSYLFECFYFQFSVKYFSAAKEIFGRIIITFQCVYFRECVCV